MLKYTQIAACLRGAISHIGGMSGASKRHSALWHREFMEFGWRCWSKINRSRLRSAPHASPRGDDFHFARISDSWSSFCAQREKLSRRLHPDYPHKTAATRM